MKLRSHTPVLRRRGRPAAALAIRSLRTARRAWPRVGLAGMGGIIAPALAAASAVATGGNALALAHEL